ncbi:MAG: 1-acyl-sn-glycerol-3-phosphate acyltransferase [Geminicoccaceae bacterium]|nr:1-acyl-sn-glycerol-3-phosphate acyltransferase [Geminicoccaceae bacterium]
MGPCLPEPEPRVIDRLIEERAGGLFEGRLGPPFRRVMYALLGYDEAVRLAGQVGRLSGWGVLAKCSEHLSLAVEVEGAEHLPRTGGFVLVANHPTGIADGIALFDLLKDRRRDAVFFGNRDALRIAPRLAEILIPVDWVKSRRNLTKSRDTFQAMARACRDGRAVVILPSGRLAHMTLRGLKERPWMPTAVSVARKYGLPIVPVHIKARNSLLYYLFAFTSDELRDVTIFHELLNKRGRRIRLRVGAPIDPATLADDPARATEWLQAYVESGLREPLPVPVPAEPALPAAA